MAVARDYVATYQITKPTTHEHIRRTVLAPCEPGKAYCRGQPVSGLSLYSWAVTDASAQAVIRGDPKEKNFRPTKSYQLALDHWAARVLL